MSERNTKHSRRSILTWGAAAAVTGGLAYAGYNRLSGSKQETKLRLAGSIYVGWMPWFLATADGTLAKVGLDYGLDVEFVRADYADSLALFSSGAVDAVVMTNIDAASIVAASGIPADVILVGSFSNGNDAILLKQQIDSDMRGKNIGLVEFSVSHYLIDRYLEETGIPFEDVSTVNVADSAIASIFASNDQTFDGVVTWNPVVDELLQRFDANLLFDSSSIPYEIADLLVINRNSLEEKPNAARALLETWFEITGRMKSDPEKLWDQLGQLAGTNKAGYQRQIEKTILVDDPATAISSMGLPQLTNTEEVLRFVDRHQLVSKAPNSPWISFENEKKGVLHYNSKPINAMIG